MSKSLRQSVRSQVVLWSCLLALAYSAVASLVYLWGLDDATEYYMLKEAELLSRQEPLPHTRTADDFRQYYRSYAELPALYQRHFPAHSLTPNQSQVYEDERQAIYLLPYHSDNTPTLYVVHHYQGDEALSPAQPLPQLLIGLIVVTLILTLLAANLMVGYLTRPILRLSTWARSLGQSGAPLPSPPGLKFHELDEIAIQLGDSINQVLAINEKEKLFLRTASHELRTPLAVVLAALDLLEQSDLNTAQRSKLGKIRKASDKMNAITSALLWLWRGDEQVLEAEVINLAGLVQDIVDELQSIDATSPLNIKQTIAPDAQATLPRPLLEIAIGNLLRNAVKYSAANKIAVTADRHGICISNVTSPDADSLEESFGLGLYIVKTIAEQQGWEFSYRQTEEQFIAELRW